MMHSEEEIEYLYGSSLFFICIYLRIGLNIYYGLYALYLVFFRVHKDTNLLDGPCIHVKTMEESVHR